MPSFTFTETLRVALAGLGDGPRLGAFAALPQAHVVALCDADERALAAAAGRVPGAATHHRFAEVLARDDVDAVVIATATRRHYEMAAAALESGRHVFVAAPLAATAGEAERLVALAADRDRRLMVGHRLRYHPAVRYVERLVADGALGAVRTVAAVRTQPGAAGGRTSVFDRLAPDVLAVARALVPSEPVAVAAQGGAFGDGALDVIFATVTHAGGELVHLHTSALAPVAARRLTVVGSHAMAVVDARSADEPVRVTQGGHAGAPADGEARSGHRGDVSIPRLAPGDPSLDEAEEFVRAIQERRAPHTDSADGLACVRLLEAVRRSLRDGGARVDV